MGKQSQIDRSIEKIDYDIAVLQAARTRLIEEKAEAEARKQKPLASDTSTK